MLKLARNARRCCTHLRRSRACDPALVLPLMLTTLIMLTTLLSMLLMLPVLLLMLLMPLHLTVAAPHRCVGTAPAAYSAPRLLPPPPPLRAWIALAAARRRLRV